MLNTIENHLGIAKLRRSCLITSQALHPGAVRNWLIALAQNPLASCAPSLPTHDEFHKIYQLLASEYDYYVEHINDPTTCLWTDCESGIIDGPELDREMTAYTAVIDLLRWHLEQPFSRVEKLSTRERIGHWIAARLRGLT